jgi:hypothetical protein
MKSFIEFLMEEVVDFYHRTDPTSALNIQKNGVNASGLSVFLDPKQAANYEGAKSNDFVPKGSPTITGKVSTSQMIPDMEMHPGAFNKMYGNISKDRPPSLSRTSQTPSGNFQYNIPGIRRNPETGKIEPGYGIVYSSDGQTFRKAHEIDLNDPSQHPYIDTRSQIQVGPKETRVLPVDKPIKIGGPTNQGQYGFKERGDLDKITSKSGPVSKNNITSEFIKSSVPNKALRTTSNVQDIKIISPESVPHKPGLGLGGKLGIAGAALGLATGADAGDLVHGLNPLSVLDGGSLGTDDVLKYDEDKESDYDPARYLKPKQSSQNNSN